MGEFHWHRFSSLLWKFPEINNFLKLNSVKSNNYTLLVAFNKPWMIGHAPCNIASKIIWILLPIVLSCWPKILHQGLATAVLNVLRCRTPYCRYKWDHSGKKNSKHQICSFFEPNSTTNVFLYVHWAWGYLKMCYICLYVCHVF